MRQRVQHNGQRSYLLRSIYLNYYSVRVLHNYMKEPKKIVKLSQKYVR